MLQKTSDPPLRPRHPLWTYQAIFALIHGAVLFGLGQLIANFGATGAVPFIVSFATIILAWLTVNTLLFRSGEIPTSWRICGGGMVRIALGRGILLVVASRSDR